MHPSAGAPPRERTRSGRRRLASLLVLAAGPWPSAAYAAPQASVDLTVGGAVENVTSSPTRGAFHLGGRADVLFLRNRGSDMAVGPYLDVATSSFHNFDAGGGAEWLLPFRDDLPVVVSGGAFWRNGEGRKWAPGLEGGLFWGSRSYNFHSWYGLAAGLFAQVRWIPATPDSLDVVFGLQLDGEILALPGLFLWQAIRHGGP